MHADVLIAGIIPQLSSLFLTSWICTSGELFVQVIFNWDSLFSEFSESLREMGDCLLEKTALNEDEESGQYEALLCLVD